MALWVIFLLQLVPVIQYSTPGTTVLRHLCTDYTRHYITLPVLEFTHCGCTCFVARPYHYINVPLSIAVLLCSKVTHSFLYLSSQQHILTASNPCSNQRFACLLSCFVLSTVTINLPCCCKLLWGLVTCKILALSRVVLFPVVLYQQSNKCNK